jgi:hypothetical protein
MKQEFISGKWTIIIFVFFFSMVIVHHIKRTERTVDMIKQKIDKIEQKKFEGNGK